ncbi:MAG: hypothetical protein ACRDL5_04960 [Solirubrobacteraceae bacterium]
MAPDSTLHRTRGTGAITPAVAGLIAACLLAAGCDSATHATSQSSNAFAAQGLAFSKCMRAHGVPNFPDPGQSVNGPASSFGGIEIPASIDMQSPAYQAAQHDCQGLFSAMFSRQGKPRITAALKASLIAQAQCMREHGVPGFQDPTFPAGGGIGYTDAGTNPQSPAFQHAQKVCGSTH